MELSRMFFDGTPELHLANFLHMITTMAESGSTEERMEFFILNSQKLGVLPIDEPVWSLSSSLENDELRRKAIPTNINGQVSKKKPAYSWPLVDWKTAPVFSYAHEHGFWKQPVDMDQSGNNTARVEGLLEGSVQGEAEVMTLTEINEDVIEDDVVVEPDLTAIPHFKHQTDVSLPMEILVDPANVLVECICPEEGQSKSRDQSNTLEAMQTGRLGELVAFRYFTGKVVTRVKWVNEDEETGLPYDILIGNEENQEYIEVKASRYSEKDWFVISTREWQFAAEKGNSFSIAHVLLSAQKLAKIVIYKNPVKLCQLGKLQLTVMVPRS